MNRLKYSYEHADGALEFDGSYLKGEPVLQYALIFMQAH